MTFIGLALLASMLLGGACWASNVFPGRGSLWRGALARVAWWAAPFGAVVWLNGAPAGNALVLALAAWAGACIPHNDYPATSDHWVLLEVAAMVLRTATVLAPPASVFWLCGAYWPAMLWAAWAILPCMWLATRVPHRWAGLRHEQDATGVLFGVSTGFFLAVAVWTPTPAPDLLP